LRIVVNPNEEVTMKRIAIAAAVLAATAFGSIAANAQGVEFDVGRGGVYVGHHHDYWRHRHFRTYGYGFGGGCRVVVRTHINRWGNRVTVRRRICD
jgi:hypothetical protein